jgi:hypothetical protein
MIQIQSKSFNQDMIKKYAIGYGGKTKNNLFNLILIRKCLTFINKN